MKRQELTVQSLQEAIAELGRQKEGVVLVHPFFLHVPCPHGVGGDCKKCRADIAAAIKKAKPKRKS